MFLEKKPCSIQLSHSRSLFLIFAIWRLRGVLDPRKHNRVPLSIRQQFSSYLRYCWSVGFSFLCRYKLRQSAMISTTFVCHSTYCSKYRWRKCPMLYLHYPLWILPLLFCFMLLVNLLWGHLSVEVHVWVNIPLYIKKGGSLSFQKPLTWKSSLAPLSLFAPLLSFSPVTGCRLGSICTSQHTISNNSASKSCSSLCHWITNPPHLHTMAWSTEKLVPHT